MQKALAMSGASDSQCWTCSKPKTIERLFLL
jgi:hypothetical protein